MSRTLAVVKIGGSVLTGSRAYRNSAAVIANRLAAQPDERLIVVVSAEAGATDALLATARDIVEEPDERVLDLLWSTGEIRSVALLTLSLHALGVRAVAANVHQTGLQSDDGAASVSVHPLRLRALTAEHDVVVVPGFLARSTGDGVASLGRGGSDLTAVLVAAGVQAVRCELLKDVAGYFTADPKEYPEARAIPWLSYSHAIQMACEGCDLVQRAAIEAARDHNIELVISSAQGQPSTRVTTATLQ
jgi:aspartate kinase